MKITYLKYLFAALPVIAFTACMDFDSPGDEFDEAQEKIDPVIYSGDADLLDYTVQPTQEQTQAALELLNDYYDQFYTAQLYLLGGKDGGMPEAHQYQYTNSLTTDNFAGYTTCTQNWGGKMSSTYTYNRDFWEGPYGRFLSIKGLVGNLLNRDESNTIVELKALALLIFDYAAADMVDLYGAIPYVDHKANKESNPFTFNRGVDIYYSIIKNLDDIVAVLDHYPERPQWYKDLVEPVMAYNDAISMNKQFETWRRFANSLKLRMAMHISKYDPAQAKTWAEEAVASGVIESKDDQMVICKVTENWNWHPLYNITVSWHDICANASFVSIVTQLQHPYINYLLTPNSEDLVNETTGKVLPKESAIIGLRAGLQMYNGQQYAVNPRVAFSAFATEDCMYMPVYAMKWAEVDFHRAEGALRGWDMGGTAQFFYERGIRNGDCSDVFVEYSGNYERYLDDYMNVTEAVPYHYEDPIDNNDIDGTLTIGVKWDDGDSQETKLEKIMTQKWLAIFPNSYEAWTDIRRTGYPKIFPVLNPQLGDGSLSYGDIIRRMPLPWGDIQAGLEDIQNSGLEALGGENLMATRVFWDVPGSNF